MRVNFVKRKMNIVAQQPRRCIRTCAHAELIIWEKSLFAVFLFSSLFFRLTLRRRCLTLGSHFFSTCREVFIFTATSKLCLYRLALKSLLFLTFHPKTSCFCHFFQIQPLHHLSNLAIQILPLSRFIPVVLCSRLKMVRHDGKVAVVMETRLVTKAGHGGAVGGGCWKVGARRRERGRRV